MIFDFLLSHHRAFSILAGFLLDCFFGDPHFLPHPVRFMGSLIAFLEKRLNKPADSPKIQRFKGFFLVFLVILAIFSVSLGILLVCRRCRRIHPILFVAIESILCYQCLAAKSLCGESMKVYRALKICDLLGARSAVSMIVGRDTDIPDEAGVAKAAVETVAESTNDGVIAPLFFMAIFGAVGGMVYKAVNTLDSMIAYKNERFLHFGFCAAKLDDIANFVPARISAVLMILSTFILRFFQIFLPPFLHEKFIFRPINAIKIFFRDRKKHASPNSAQTESVCAGALGVQLAGDTVYGGVVEKKEFIGDKAREIEAKDIVRANALMYAATILSVGICVWACAKFL